MGAGWLLNVVTLQKNIMRKVKIAIIDTGVNMEHPYLKNNIIEDVVISKNTFGKIQIKNGEHSYDVNGHGTACASVIKKECPEVEIISVQALDRQGRCSLDVLEYSLEYVSSLQVDIVNLSLALIDSANISVIKSQCRKINDNKIIVSALGNHMTKSYPASMKCNIGVRGSILDNIDDMWFNKRKIIQCVLDSTPYLHADCKNEYSMFGKCNSYAAARLTGIIAKIMSDNIYLERSEILRELENRANRKYWSMLNICKSRRLPEINRYLVNSQLEQEVGNYMKLYLHKDEPLGNMLLLSQSGGLQYIQCFELLKSLQRDFHFHIRDYTSISREDFYSVNSIAHLIQRSKQVIS